MSKLSILFILLCLCIPAFAQESQVSGGVVFTPVSRGTGDGASVGVRGEAVVEFNEFYRAVAEASWSLEEKLYIGDGSGNAFRGRAEFRAQWPGRGYYVAPFIGAGVSMVRRNTSEYTKTAFNPIITAGLNIQDRVIPYVRWYLPEHQTPNKARAFEVGTELYLPLAKESPWLIRAGLAGQRTSYTQPFGPLAGQISTWSLRTHLGAGYRF